jgi:sulfide dehydrogenase cytochrome subunit
MTRFRSAAVGAAFATVAAACGANAQTIVPPSGATLAATCTGCHGPAGQSAGAIPSIHGRAEADLLQAMLDFKNDRRPATMMNRHAKGFSDEELAALAREIATNWR